MTKSIREILQDEKRAPVFLVSVAVAVLLGSVVVALGMLIYLH